MHSGCSTSKFSSLGAADFCCSCADPDFRAERAKQSDQVLRELSVYKPDWKEALERDISFSDGALVNKTYCALCYAPHAVDHVGLGELYDDGAAAELVAGVAGVPVVVDGVPVEEGVPAPRHPLDHARGPLDRRHVLPRNCKTKTAPSLLYSYY